MVLYTSIIFAVGFVLALFNCLFGGYVFPAWQVILWVVLAIILSILLDGLIAFIHRLIPYKYYKEDNAYFREKEKERKFYEKLKVRAWKDKIPELGGKLKYFDKSKLEKDAGSEYFMTFIKETCMGEMIHFVSIICAPLLLIILPPSFTWTIGLPVVVVNMLLQIPSIFTNRKFLNLLEFASTSKQLLIASFTTIVNANGNSTNLKPSQLTGSTVTTSSIRLVKVLPTFDGLFTASLTNESTNL